MGSIASERGNFKKLNAIYKTKNSAPPIKVRKNKEACILFLSGVLMDKLVIKMAIEAVKKFIYGKRSNSTVIKLWIKRIE